jgi:hypothetical protein
MTEREIAEQKRKAEEAERRKVEAAERAVREAEEAKNKAAADFAADVAATKAEKQARGAGSLPVPEHNPGIASAVEKKEKKPFWKLFSQDSEPREAQQVQPVVNESAALQADQGSGEAGKTARTAAVAQETDAVATLPVAGGEAGQQVVEQTQKKPFWKFWQK